LSSTTFHATFSPIASDGGGAIATVFGDSPAAYIDWASAAALWDEYRVLCTTIHWMPLNKYNTPTSTIVGVLYHAIDRDDATALTSESTALEYESARANLLSDKFERTVKMAGIEDSTWITTASPTSRMWIKFYSSGLTASTNYGKVWVDAIIQFRGRN
jgi:hypothetical protein